MTYTLKSLDDYVIKLISAALMESSGATVQTVKTEDAYLSIEEVCKLLKIHKSTLWRWRKQGLIPYMQYGRTVRFKLSDINIFIDQNYLDYGSN